MLKNQEIDQIKHVLIKQISPYYIILFGSFAKGKMRPDSDVDIGFLCDQLTEPYSLFLVAQELADLLNREVDLIDLQTASTVMQAQIITTGVPIYCTNEQKRMEFEMKVLKMYAKLNEERDPILRKWLAGGNKY